MELEEFYERCARLLDTEHEAHQIRRSQERPTHDGLISNNYRNRWNNRTPGNGRMAGRGIVRHYGACIHVALHTPPIYGIYASVADALAAIENAVYKAAWADACAKAKAFVQQAGVTVDPRLAHRKTEKTS